jgi:pimeloyl-ACP methyl ester carboxylesterase
VLVHAFLDSRMWDDQWEAFGRDFQVVRFDMRGYGKSALTDGPISRRRDLERHRDVCLGVVARLGEPRPRPAPTAKTVSRTSAT